MTDLHIPATPQLRGGGDQLSNLDDTVFNRLRRLEQLTSRSLQRPRDVVELTLALEAARLTGD